MYNQRRSILGICACVIFIGCAAQAQAQDRKVSEPEAPATATAASATQAAPGSSIPQEIKFSGVLSNASGRPVTGTIAVSFALYDQQKGGTAFWSETQNVEADLEGRYSVVLGTNSGTGLPAELFRAGEGRWLGIRVLAPEAAGEQRVRWVSVPYAMKAGDAETLGGKPASAYALATTAATTSTDGSGTAGSTPQTGTAGGTVKPPGKKVTPAAVTGTTNFIPVFTDNAGSLGNSLLVQSGNSIGLGTAVGANPTIQLDVNGGIRGTGLATAGRNVAPDAINTNALFLNGSNAMGVIGTNNAAFAPGALFTKTSFFSGGLERMTINGTTGNVGVGTQTPGQKLSVAGMIQSTTGGFVFPDATVQITAAQLSAASLVRAITYLAGCDSCSPLTAADSQNTIFVNLIGSMTINSVTCFSDAGAPTVNIQRNQGGTLTNVLSSNLTCAATGAASSSLSTSALSLNDSLNFTMAMADGVAKRVTVIVQATVN